MVKAYLHTIKSCNFQISGFGSVDVSNFTMTLAPGTIPTANIGVSLHVSASGASSKSTIEGFSLDTVAKKFNTLLELAAQAKTCNFRLSLKTTRLSDGATGTQDIQLNNWVLIAAGLGSITTTNGFSVVCTIAHPVYKLAMHGGFLTNFNESLRLEELAESVTDPISAGVAVYNQINEVQEKLKFECNGTSIKPGNKSADAIISDVESVFKQVPSMLQQYLEWKPNLGGGSSGIPFQSLLTGKLQLAAKQIMLETWIPVGAASVWDLFINIVCSEFDLTTIPDYTKEKLPVCPFYPWMSSTLELNEQDLFEISFPGTDPAPVYGVCASPQMEAALDKYPSTYTRETSENLSDQATVTAYVPKANADINGKFFSGALPEWLVDALELAPGLNSQDMETSSLAGEIPKEESSSGDNEEMLATNDLKMQSLACQFLKLFKKRLEASINAPLLISRNGEDPFLPGKVLSIKTNGETLLEGVIVQLTHYIDMAQGIGNTSMHLAYCRPGKGYKITNEVLDKNPMYS